MEVGPVFIGFGCSGIAAGRSTGYSSRLAARHECGGSLEGPS